MSLDPLSYPSPIEKELRYLFPRGAHVIFDVGSFNGNDAIRYSQLFPSCRVFAFEPVPENYTTLQKAFSAFRNIRSFPFAMGETPGSSEFHVSSMNVGTGENVEDIHQSSSLLPPDEHLKIYPHTKFDKRITVKTETLKSFCKEQDIQEIDLVHLDVQGAELMVLRGAGDFIPFIHSWWIEVEHVRLYKNQPLEPDVRRFMKQHGFILFKYHMRGFSSDQLYVSRSYIEQTKGKTASALLSGKSILAHNQFIVLLKRLFRKLSFGK